jgi:NAD(P)-dependent dehydrogenase (short-subunit alcohol dehydrogenase family)
MTGASRHDYASKVALVTGGGSGIGRMTAASFAAAGASVVVADVDKGALEVVVKEIEDAGGRATGIGCDVTRASEVERAVAVAVDTYGRLDAAFNNAGVEGIFAGTADLDEEVFDRVQAVNVRGVWLSMKYEVPAMIASGGGAIVNAASVMGLRGAAGGTAYCASKHAVVGLTKVAALDYAQAGVRVNATAPGMIDTPMMARTAEMMRVPAEAFADMHPIGRTGRPRDVADAVLWLCSDAAAFLTGVVLPVDGGFTAR